MTKRILFLGLVISILALGVSAYAQPLTIKFGHSGTKVHQYHIGATMLAEQVEKNSGGKMKIEVFPDAQLGGERDLAEGTRLGTVDMAVVAAGSVLPLWVPEFQIVEMPFLFRDRAHAYKVLDGVLGDELKGLADKKSLKVLGFWEVGFRNMTNNKKPIQEPADMQGLKIRVQQSKVYIEMMKSLGAIGTPIAFTELYSALQQGVVDGQENPAATIATMKFYDVQKYLIKTGHIISGVYIWTNEKFLTALPADLQKAIKEAATEAAAWANAGSFKLEDEFLKRLTEEYKMTPVEPDRQAFIEAAQPLLAEYETQWGTGLLEKVRAVK